MCYVRLKTPRESIITSTKSNIYVQNVCRSNKSVGILLPVKNSLSLLTAREFLFTKVEVAKNVLAKLELRKGYWMKDRKGICIIVCLLCHLHSWQVQLAWQELLTLTSIRNLISRFTSSLNENGKLCSSTIFQSYRDLEVGDTQSLKSELQDPVWNPGTFAPQTKSKNHYTTGAPSHYSVRTRVSQ